MVAALLGLCTALAAFPAGAGQTIDQIRTRGTLVCGINPVIGMATFEPSGRWNGFLVEFCRAIAAAVLGDSERLEVVAVESGNRFDALASGSIDVLTDGATWTLGRESELKLIFPATYLYDGQGFLAHKDLKVRRLKDAGAATVCAITETTSIRNLEDYLATHPLAVRVLPVHSNEGGWSSFLKRRCDVITNDLSGLIVRRARHSPNPDDYVLLEDVISKEPLGPAVRADDQQWAQVVRWVILSMVAAEEKGLSKASVRTMTDSPDPEVRALLGIADDHAKALNLEPGWARRIIEQVGNYGEVFEQHLGSGSPLKLDRGLNRLWTDGGLLYAPPFK